ncbi:MAG: hypothetical protein Q7R30_19350 [Acidobacteriota bacterium]|nr:hypothetical protein [Acidobacteriota bacterium]
MAVPQLHASRVDMVGVLRRVDVAVDAPLSRSADAALRRHRPRKLCSGRGGHVDNVVVSRAFR